MKNRSKRILKRSLLSAVVFFLALGIVLIIVAEQKLSRFVLGGLGEGFSTTVYSAPFVFEDGARFSAAHLLRRLKRLGYREKKAGFLSPGEYQHFAEDRFTLFLRAVETPALVQNGSIVYLEAESPGKWSVLTEDGKPIGSALLEPELITELSGDKRVRREPAEWEEIPIDLVNAVVAVEDNRFYRHWGVDPLAIGRAILANLRHLEKAQGGSTITQQLVKNVFLTPKKTFRRKLAEGFLAVYMNIRFSKNKILTLYLNHIYLGQDGIVSVAGVQSAAEYYFDKDVSELSLPESAFLAGLIRSPSKYNPFQNPAQAKTRRDFVLKRMMDEGTLTHHEYVRAVGTPLEINRNGLSFNGDNQNMSRYFVDELVRSLKERYPEDVLFRYGLEIYTTMDPLAQETAQTVLSKGKHQAAMVVMDPFNGDVLALVGGRDYQKSQFNRATQALRQPGSAFKPFIYAAALENGSTPVTILRDEPKEYRSDGERWKPQNFDGLYRGKITLRQALAESRNAATLDLMTQLGIDKVVEFAERLGIERPLRKNISLGLGTSELTLLELTNGYAPFANGGLRVKPRFITAILDAEKNILEADPIVLEPAISSALATLMTSLLETTITSGTAKSLANYGWAQPAAGKTGTTNRGRDGWFIGYTPDVLVGVWVGNDEAKAVNVSGSGSALPLWARFMSGYKGGAPGKSFLHSNDVLRIKIDPLSGGVARSGCPQTVEEIFIRGSEPVMNCPLHIGGIKGWFERFFKKRE